MARSSIVTIHTASPARPSALPQLIEKLKDPDTPLLHLLLLIRLEIALIVEDLQKYEGNTTKSSELKSHIEQLRALRVLADSVLRRMLK